MPLYEYGCEKCGHVVEKLQSNPESPAPESCKKCDAKGTMTRMISRSSFQLKGSGWYVTDYASPKSEPAGDASQASSPAADVPAGEASSKDSSSEASPGDPSSGASESSKSSSSTTERTD